MKRLSQEEQHRLKQEVTGNLDFKVKLYFFIFLVVLTIIALGFSLFKNRQRSLPEEESKSPIPQVQENLPQENFAPDGSQIPADNSQTEYILPDSQEAVPEDATNIDSYLEDNQPLDSYSLPSIENEEQMGGDSQIEVIEY